MMRLVFIISLTVVLTLALSRGANQPASGRLLQVWNAELAARDVPQVEAALREPPEITGVTVTAIEPYNGGLAIHGEVGTDAELFRLYRRVADMTLRVPVYWTVKVRGEEP